MLYYIRFSQLYIDFQQTSLFNYTMNDHAFIACHTVQQSLEVRNTLLCLWIKSSYVSLISVYFVVQQQLFFPLVC